MEFPVVTPDQLLKDEEGNKFPRKALILADTLTSIQYSMTRTLFRPEDVLNIELAESIADDVIAELKQAGWHIAESAWRAPKRSIFLATRVQISISAMPFETDKSSEAEQAS